MPTRRAFAAVAGVLWVAGPVMALPTAYRSRAEFEAALAASGPVELAVLDFDALAVGALIAPGDGAGGIRFEYDLGGFELLVIDRFDTTSPPNSLGLSGGDDAFLSGDGFELHFEAPIHALGLLVNAELLFADEVSLEAGGAIVANSGSPELALSDGFAYFLGLIESDPGAGFTSAALASADPGGGDFFLFDVDDIRTARLVPEPGSLALSGAGLALLAASARRR